jgi:hypothetical protein
MHTRSRRSSSSFFMEIKRVVYQAHTLNFCVKPGLTFGMLRKRDP